MLVDEDVWPPGDVLQIGVDQLDVVHTGKLDLNIENEKLNLY